MNEKGLAFDKAKNYAFVLLKFRLRSEKELAFRLKKKKFDDIVIDEVIAYLKEKRFIDDSLFAKMWVEWRIKKPLGFNRLKTELKSKGINEEVIAKVLSDAKEQYNEDELIFKLAKQKLTKIKGIQPYKAKRRLYSYFIRRGFSPEVVSDIINQL